MTRICNPYVAYTTSMNMNSRCQLIVDNIFRGISRAHDYINTIHRCNQRYNTLGRRHGSHLLTKHECASNIIPTVYQVRGALAPFAVLGRASKFRSLNCLLTADHLQFAVSGASGVGHGEIVDVLMIKLGE